jgi:hypothetical protein
LGEIINIFLLYYTIKYHGTKNVLKQFTEVPHVSNIFIYLLYFVTKSKNIFIVLALTKNPRYELDTQSNLDLIDPIF